MPYTTVPAHLRGLTLAEANVWGKVYDEARAGGHSEAEAARIAWGAARQGRADAVAARSVRGRARYPMHLERAYAKRLEMRSKLLGLALVETVIGLLRTRTDASYEPGLSVRIREALMASRAQVDGAAPVTPTGLRTTAEGVSGFARTSAGAQLEVLGLNRPLTRDEARVLAWARENAALIRANDDRAVEGIAEAVTEGITAGRSPESIARAVRYRTGVNTRHARVIARDQIAKLNARIQRDEFEAAGVTRYRRRTMGDDRVRPTHAVLDGKVFRWDSPPSVGHPGDDYGCRCMAEPLPPGRKR